ncbi:MAG: NTP transferase domain-containing protein [Nocardioides sp.]|jgi:molybdopterin-guanine dinucleotide biosynthesis protein A
MPVEPAPVAIILTGGTGARLGGTDKAALEIAGSTLLERALTATACCSSVVVVGGQTPTSRVVRFTRESPVLGGPAAGLLAGLEAVEGSPEWVVVLAVDMPYVTSGTVSRLLAAAARDGAWLIGPDGRRALAGVLASSALRRVDPGPAARHGLPFFRLLRDLDLVAVPASSDEVHDVDNWADVPQ